MKKVYHDMNEVCVKTAEWFVAEANEAIAKHGKFTVALSGGSTPRQLFMELAKPEWQKQMDWSKVFVFWGDERFVARTDAQSNQKMARETLLDHVPVAEKNIIPVPFLATAELSAKQYEVELKKTFSNLPKIDLILLGLGADGHTASLFPGSLALTEETRWVCPSQPKAGGPERITLTYPVINNGELVCFLVTGAEKAAIVKEILEATSGSEEYPAQRIQPTSGKLLWILDRAAASALKS
jgi:6-phosphogluconolactonase